MSLAFCLRGMLIGFCIAAPVGPIGVLCIRRSLAEGTRVGFATGLGAATADALYGCVAGFGLTAVSSFLVSRQLWVGLLGGMFLSYLGVRTFLSKPRTLPTPPAGDSIFAAYSSTFLLTLTNPATILSFAAIFPVVGLRGVADYWSASFLVMGVFLGSALWWLILSVGVGLLRPWVDGRWMQGVNRLSGIVLLSFGIVALSRSLM
jgi:threonine/homoserine/homoserine lactone efflux protein